MLQVLLLILKILLWVVLGILGLLLLLILLILFAPIKYQVDAKYYGKAKILAKVSFLIVSVKVFFDQETKEMTNVIRILGIPFKPKSESKPKDVDSAFDDEDDEFNLEEELVEDVPSVGLSNIQNEHITDGTDEPVSSIVSGEEANDETGSTNTALNEEFDLWDNDDKTLPEEEKKLSGRIKVFIRKLWEKLIKVKDFIINLNPDTISDTFNKKTAKIRRTINRFKQFWNMKCTIKTRAYLKKYIVSVIKHIAPRKVKGYIHFGMDEPYKTGQVIGYLSMIPFVYQKHLTWEPDFYNKVMEGELYLKGRLRIGYIARIVLKLHVWKTIKMATKITK